MVRKLSVFGVAIVGLIIALTTQLHSREDRTLRAPLEFRKSILDVHSHLACLNFPGCYIRPEFKNTFKFKMYMKASGLESSDLERTSADELMLNAYLKRINESELYGGAIVYALDGFYDQNGDLDRAKTDVMIPNDYISEVTSKARNLYFGASINPNKKNAIEELDRVYNQGAKLVKWIPCTMGIDLKNPTPQVEDFLDRMKELNLPLVTHVGGESTFSWADEKLCDPRSIETVLKKGISVIAAHGAISGKFDQKPGYTYLLELVQKYPNLYVDNSAGLFVNRFGFYKDVFLTNFHGRTLQGTDYPLSYISFAGFQAISLPQFKSEMSDFWYQYAKKTKSVHDLEAAIKIGLGTSLKDIKLSYEVFNIPYKSLKENQ
jgi:predicted TIM-barrel fold metal-dependent hydrolase